MVKYDMQLFVMSGGTLNNPVCEPALQLHAKKSPYEKRLFCRDKEPHSPQAVPLFHRRRSLN